jgi:hypothetical protein
LKLLIMHFSPASFYFIPLGSKYSPWHPGLKQTPSVYVLPLISETKFHTHTMSVICQNTEKYRGKRCCTLHNNSIKFALLPSWHDAFPG